MEDGAPKESANRDHSTHNLPEVNEPAEPEHNADQDIQSRQPATTSKPDDDIDTIEYDNQLSEHQPSDQSAGLVVSSEGRKHHFLRPESIFPRVIRSKLGHSARPLSLLIILVVLAGAAFGYLHYGFSTTAKHQPQVRFKAKTVAFAVVSTTPAKNQSNVNPASPIKVIFNQPVNPKKLATSFFVSPAIAGKYTQGNNKDAVTFTPSTAFAQGTKVQIMINGTFQSNQGSQLGADYFYGFTTSIPDNGVLFQDSNGLIDTLSNAASGQSLSYSLLVGNGVDQGITVTLYKGNINSLLTSLVYTNVTSYGSTVPQFVNQYVDTAGLTAISTKTGIANNQTYTVNQADGIYLAVATGSGGRQLGYVWIDISNFGVLLREDDHKIVLDAQSYSATTNISTNASFYNLDNGINLLDQQQLNGLTTVNLPLNPSVDVVVATDGNEQAIVPVSIIESQGDIRADSNLSAAQDFYALTDKPTYEAGDVVHLAGFVRQDNDAQYTVPSGITVKMYVANPNDSSNLYDFTAVINSNGSFSASIPTSPSWLSQGDSLSNFQIYAQPAGTIIPSNPLPDVNVASFNLTNQPASTSNVTVQFSSSSYLPTQPIQATITATDSNGNPLANATVDVHTFSKDYYENNPGENFQSFGDVGIEVNGSPVTVKLNANGQASYIVPVSSLPNDGYSQDITLQANVQGASGAGAAGGASAIVHQGNGLLVFGMGRTVVAPGGKLVGRIYAEQLDGSPLPDAMIRYSLVSGYSGSNQTKLASGSVTADGNGYAEIDINLPSNIQAGANLTLNATTSDTYNNQIQASNYYYVADPSGAEDYSGAQLGELDVSGSSGNVKVGDQLNLVINSPQTMQVMVTMDRGRIYYPEMLSLNAGNNNFSFSVTKQLAPSFTLTFGYFQNGTYHSEGTSFNVSEPAQKATITLSGINQTVVANQPVSLNINAKDYQGNPLPTDVIVDVVDTNAFDLFNPAVPSMYDSLYSPRVLMTSSSSSLTNIGSGGGRCGGGFGSLSNFANALGTTLYWQPDLTTDANGNATVSFSPPKGKWTVNVYTMNANSIVGSASTTFTAQ